MRSQNGRHRPHLAPNRLAIVLRLLPAQPPHWFIHPHRPRHARDRGGRHDRLSLSGICPVVYNSLSASHFLAARF